ncbi:glycerate kinase [Budvicia diplopodorum]|uniref:glycerate kinase n=1 Tax=Budvicia diplopodorum TaxID=1119056 RepID=UPI0013573930|nr:glycerate kinase [Budvicia diplopodorum]
MKIIIAPDSFKESLSAQQAANAIEQGFRQIFPDIECLKLPVADGGEGTVAALVAATNGREINLTVTGPQGTPVSAFYGINGKGTCAVIEMAAASGLMLVSPAERNPLTATSLGTGELIRHVLDAGIRHIILGVGGSATVDGGVGMVQALGGKFSDADGRELEHGGGALSSLAHIDLSELDSRLSRCLIEVACDVENPLTGPAGAAAVFGPQKGATPEMVVQLEQGLCRLAEVINNDLHQDVSQLVGGGAAGGMGMAAKLFLNGNMRSGIDIIIEAIGLRESMLGTDLVIVGEGRIDRQTIEGKAPIGVARLARRYQIPVIGIAGVLGEGVDIVHQHGIDAVFSILPRLEPLDMVLTNAESNLRYCARNIAQMMKLGARQ